ncbi:MAG: polyphenol oxidase family protein [Desulfovibrio sp.]|nr:polyphenol oxidase family protein [Desulfovibrio sp.]
MKQRITLIFFTFPGLPTVGCAFQTRVGGMSIGPYGRGNIAWNVGDNPDHVAANRASLDDILRSRGVGATAELEQVHGDILLFDPDETPGNAAPSVKGDGMATQRRGLGLLIRTADCQPLLLAHKGGRHIAALHVGWRGNRCAFPVSGVRRFCEKYGIKPADLLAVRGPSLSPARAEFVHFDREWGPEFRPWFDPATRTMNLWGLVKAQLLEAGLRERDIYGLDLCTAENSELFFSYRAEKVCGRQANLIWIR